MDFTSTRSGNGSWQDTSFMRYLAACVLAFCSLIIMAMAQAAAPVPCADSKYTCQDEPKNYSAATQPLLSVDSTPISGYNSFIKVKLPFTFKFYGQNYDYAYVALNGLITFLSGTGQPANYAVLDANTPKASIMPFWDEFGSEAPFDPIDNFINGETRGQAPNRQFVIEWGPDGVLNDATGASLASQPSYRSKQFFMKMATYFFNTHRFSRIQLVISITDRAEAPRSEFEALTIRMGFNIRTISRRLAPTWLFVLARGSCLISAVSSRLSIIQRRTISP